MVATGSPVGGRLRGHQYRTNVLRDENGPDRHGHDRRTGRDRPAVRLPMPRGRHPPVAASRRSRSPCSSSSRDCRAPAPLPTAPPSAAAATIRPRSPGIAPLTHQVYGYLPYWRLDAGTADQLDYDLVSTIAFFGLGIKATGDLDMAWVGYAGLHQRRRRRRDQRRPRPRASGSSRRSSCSTRGSLPKMTRVPRQHGRPEPVHRPGPRPHGRAARPTARTSTSSRCRAARDAAVPGVRSPSSARR